MRFLPIIILPFLCSCNPDKSDHTLSVSVGQIALQTAPGLKKEVVTTLLEGKKLKDLGEVSHFESVITFGYNPIQSPWIKVESSSGKQGWVFAGALKPEGEFGPWLQQKRLQCYFGKALTARVESFPDKVSALTDEEHCALSYRQIRGMRDTMLFLLKHRAEPEGQVTYDWMANLVPGLVYQRSLTGDAPDMFFDYGHWLKTATKSTGDADDAFFKFNCMIFPMDSVESPFPVWKFQMSATESASQLGTGVHVKVLDQIDQLLSASPIFKPELLATKDAILDDILDKNTQFWQTKDLILQELDSILVKTPACLNTKESSALKVRRVMLEAAENNGVRIGLRSGEISEQRTMNNEQ
ncbi:MAG: SH3 domain-containing protein [Saprospiraceae bacterium]